MTLLDDHPLLPAALPDVQRRRRSARRGQLGGWSGRGGRHRELRRCRVAICAPGAPRVGGSPTEYDWMAFLYELNTGPGVAAPMTDIWRIYRHACNPPEPGAPVEPNPPECGGQSIVWAPRPITDQPNPVACTAASDCNIEVGESCFDTATNGPCMASGACTCKLTAVETGFIAGVQRLYVGDPDRVERATTLGNTFGVSRDLTP